MKGPTYMSIAREIALRLTGAVAVTLAGGYAVFEDGRRVLFPAGMITEERRNQRGRVTHLLSSYPDGSGLRFTYSDNRGPYYETVLA
jgi:hypothetical protein